MSHFHRLLSVFAAVSPSRRARRRPAAAALESLESRVLLTTYFVTNTNDAGSGSLRTAMIDAENDPGPDMIRFNKDLTGQSIKLLSSLPTITESLNVKGPAASKDAIIIDGQGTLGIRPFEVSSTATLVNFRDLTITGGNTSEGGGLRNAGPNTRLTNVRVIGNVTGESGGGIYNNSGLTVTFSDISGNYAVVRGGGLINSNSGTTVISLSSINGNRATASGGGIQSYGALTVRTTSVRANLTSSFGGGISNQLGPLLLDQSLVSENVSNGDGGGVNTYGAGASLTILNSTIAYNVSRPSTSAGGGIWTDAHTTIINSTIVGNTTQSTDGSSAGGIYRSGSNTLNAYNSVIAQNFAPGGNPDINSFSDVTGSFLGSTSGDPLLGPLQDNGGPTLSMMPLPGSPLIDAGGDSAATVDGQLGSPPLAGDQRTFSRFIDSLPGLNVVDIGAVEYNPGPDVPYVTGADAGQQPRISLYNQDGTVRWSKLAFASSFTGGVRVAMGDVTGDGVQDVIVGEGPGGQSRFRVYDGLSGALIGGRSPFGSTYTGGLFVAAGDFNGDGRDDVVSGSGGATTSRIRVRNAADLDQNLRNIRVGTPADQAQVRVAVGNVNNSGRPDLIATLGPRVIVFDGALDVLQPTQLHNFTPFGANFGGLMTLASGLLNAGNAADIIVGRDTGGPARIRLYAGNTGPAGGQPTFLQEIVASEPGSTSGVRVAARDIDGDGLAEIITAPGPGGDPIVRTYWSATGFTTFNAFTDEFLTGTKGLFVAVG